QASEKSLKKAVAQELLRCVPLRLAAQCQLVEIAAHPSGRKNEWGGERDGADGQRTTLVAAACQPGAVAITKARLKGIGAGTGAADARHRWASDAKRHSRFVHSLPARTIGTSSISILSVLLSLPFIVSQNIAAEANQVAGTQRSTSVQAFLVDIRPR